MTDRRRVTHPAPPGRLRAAGINPAPRVVVVGAGIAGLAAATGLAERGVRVEVVEREPYLGGRVGAWNEDSESGDSLAMNRGFHAFFRQYYNLRNLLRRIDSELTMLAPVEDYPLVDADGRRDTFRGLPTTPPFNALVFALRSPTFRLRDVLRLNARAAAPLAAVSVPGIYRLLDDLDAETFLREINFPDAARHLAFDVFSRSFFAKPADLSAAELATMFHIYFLGSSEGLRFDVVNANFDRALWNPLREYLESCGARFRTTESVRAVDTDGGLRVHLESGDQIDADGVVLAAHSDGLRHIVGNSPTLGDPAWRQRIGELRTAAAFVVQRLWLDRPVNAERPAFLGTAGRAPVDNVSVVNRYEDQARSWSRQHGGAVVELHSYAVAAEDSHGLRERMLARMHELYPETKHARIIEERLLCRKDCPRFAPGEFARRPHVATPHPGVVLAGDGVRIDLPVALMERAATTGWSAANQLLSRFGLAGHPLTTVPTDGRSAVLRRCAGLGRR